MCGEGVYLQLIQLIIFFPVKERSEGRIFLHVWHLFPFANLHIFAERDARVGFVKSLLKSLSSHIIGWIII